MRKQKEPQGGTNEHLNVNTWIYFNYNHIVYTEIIYSLISDCCFFSGAVWIVVMNVAVFYVDGSPHTSQ